MSAMSELDAAVNWAAQYSAVFSGQAETISDLRCTLAERDEYIAELERRLKIATERANAAETALKATRKRAGFDPDGMARTLDAAMEAWL